MYHEGMHFSKRNCIPFLLIGNAWLDGPGFWINEVILNLGRINESYYFDCGMGAAEDMLAAALIELLPNPDEFIYGIKRSRYPGVHTNLRLLNVVFRAQLSVIINRKKRRCIMLHGHNHGRLTYNHDNDTFTITIHLISITAQINPMNITTIPV